MKILNFGSCNIDFVYFVDHIGVPGETISGKKLELYPGGKGLNQSIAAARAGAQVFHAGCIGNDGNMLKDVLCESGVDVYNLCQLDTKNGHAIIQVSRQGENSIVLYPGSNALVSREIIDRVLSNFSKDDIVLLQNEISNVPYIIDAAYKKGMKIAFNPAPFDESLKKIDFSKISYLILNETEAMGFTGFENYQDSIDYLSKHYSQLTVILTVGKQGSIYCKNGSIVHQPAFKVEAVDTTAAGDTFIGYFLAGICSKMSVAASLKRASIASALAVSKMGAAPSIPYEFEVSEAEKTLCEYPSNKKNTKANIINKYIEENLKDADINALAKNLGYTKVYTGSIVKSETGLTFSSLLQNKRCEKAAQLLADSNLSVGEIIEEIGYSNESFFRKCFKDIYNITPLKYRNENKK